EILSYDASGGAGANAPVLVVTWGTGDPLIPDSLTPLTITGQGYHHIYGSATFAGGDDYSLTTEVSINGTDWLAAPHYRYNINDADADTDYRFAIYGLTPGTAYTKVKITWENAGGIDGSATATTTGTYATRDALTYPVNPARPVLTTVFSNARS